ncbi:TetR/AcrR family transcriptional regulator [Streptomyces inhibens]|uniref:TetR/AcrR family transcriptional regulator n=1 Tax=Streptomyces inhibens TaxID=2293571 RepID=UPI001EE77776|nr:TetR/AcrR family transcriptional regulator [Streptomyces inhibens]UKY50871.1 TetR/AcrR family transcriptional regulator; helix-turn-helix transcriptional regulator [Streptomyces inhibens]
MAIQQRRERERAQRHQLIVQAARELAETEGWGAVTTRRLAERIEYSQPVLYSHFAGKGAIVNAVALEGFAELAEATRLARTKATQATQVARTTAGEGAQHAALLAVARAYAAFARANQALYDAMFTLATDLSFGSMDSPQPLKDAFVELLAVFGPLAGTDGDPETFTEVGWSALHGLVTLDRDGRLRDGDGYQDQRIALLIARLAGEVSK